jgi:RNA polymerase sigma factor (sigma-70 family)
VGQTERVVESTYSRVRASVHGIAGQDSPDCVQEAFTRAIANGIPTDAEPWLKTVAKRVAIDKFRRRHEYASGAPVELEALIHDHDGDPQEAFVRAERSAEVRAALAKLPARYREALITYAEEDSPAAVASRLGLSANAAWTLLSRARSRLRLQLEQLGYAPVAWLGRVRWRGFAIGGAAAGVATAVAMSPLVPHHHVATQKPAPAAIVRTTKVASTAKSVPHVALPSPTSALPQLPVAAPDVAVPSLPPAPSEKELASACVGTPNLGPVAGVSVAVP